MKTKFIIAMALSILLVSCSHQQKEKQTVFSGILPNLKNTTITLLPVENYFPGLKSVDTSLTVQTDSTGKYIFRFSSSKATFYQIIYNNYHQLKADIYLEPGDSLFIEQLQSVDFPTFLIRGEGSHKLKYLEKDFAVFQKNRAFYEKVSSNTFPTEFDFKRFIDSIYIQRIETLNAVENLSSVLKNHHLNSLKADRAQQLLEHLERRNYHLQQSFDYFYPHDSYCDFLDSLSFDNDFAATTSAKLLTNSYLNYLSRQEFKSKTDNEWWQEGLGWKMSFIVNQPISLWRDALALSTIVDYSFGLMNDDFFADLESFETKIENTFYDDNNQNIFEKNIKPYKNLAPGSPAPDFELPDSAGVLHRLSDFKGSVVYIDFWGTWCSPCIEEIPKSLELQEKYKNQPVTFIYVALEYDSSNIAEWKEFISGNNPNFNKFLNHKPFSGIHLVAEQQFWNKAISAYQLNFAPTHILIDQYGNIVQARAKGPQEIEKDIDELLKTRKEE